VHQLNSRRASLDEQVRADIDRAALAALGDEPVDFRFKGLPPSWAGLTVAQVREQRPRLFGDGPTGPVCVLSADALQHNLATMADWCSRAGVALAPHGKTHMAPQLFDWQLDAGACAITVATISQLRVCRAFGVREVILANQLLDSAGLRWLAGELDADAGFGCVCWVDSVRGVQIMSAELAAAGAHRPVDVCVEVGMVDGRSGCRSAAEVDEVARAAAAAAPLRLVGVSGYEAARGHDVTADALGRVTTYLRGMRAVVHRLGGLFEADEILVTAGGSTYFDSVADVLTGWPAGLAVRTVIRSGAYLTHDDGLYARTSPLSRGGTTPFRPALSVWAQAVARPEPDLAVLTMGRRDVSFDQDMPVPRGLPGGRVTKLNDQHAYLSLRPADQPLVRVGTWVEFGVSHPCTVFDKWQLIPMLDADGRVVDLIRTFF
jgi:D-serine deaminase-like pyridoxal phosphate-dependent protein